MSAAGVGRTCSRPSAGNFASPVLTMAPTPNCSHARHVVARSEIFIAKSFERRAESAHPLRFCMPVRRECLRLSRKMFRHEELDDERIKAQLAGRSTDELRTELAFAIESLPPHYLEMILLRDFEELTIAAICERLDVSVATAKARLRRARVLVREYILGAGQSSPAGAVSSENSA